MLDDGMTITELEPAEREALESVCADGARHALEAVGRLMSVPSEDVALDSGSLETLPEAYAGLRDDTERFGVAFALSGGLSGGLLLVADETAVKRAAARLLGSESETIDERSRAVLSEIGNIVASAFLNGIADRMHRACLPSVPELLEGDQVIRRGLRRAARDARVGITAHGRVGAGDDAVEMHVIVALTADGVRSLQRTAA
jgi:chemotaxis protein CheY-P-specific phosphatase CheC